MEPSEYLRCWLFPRKETIQDGIRRVEDGEGRVGGSRVGRGRVERIQPADGTTEGTVCTPVKMLINGKLSFICINLPDMRSVWNIFFRKH